MKILFYTSERPSPVDRYNMHRLMEERPHHEYAIVSVQSAVSPVTPWIRFKRRMVEWRDGRNEWIRALDHINASLRERTPHADTRKPRTTIVERVNGSSSVSAIGAFQPDILVQAGAGILKANIYDLARTATINVHHGLAPEVRGMRSTFWCLYHGLHELIGVTCHQIDATLDTGAVVGQRRVDYRPGQNFTELQLTVCINGADVLIRSIDDLERGSFGDPIRREIDSYYFGELAPDQFNALHRNGYRPLGNASDLRTKRKVKTILSPIRDAEARPA